jgi:Cu/Ag efflux protein CusF
MKRYGRTARMKQLPVVLSMASFLVLCPKGAALAQTPSDGGIDEVEVVHATGVVEKIDLEKRRVTLMMDDGKSKKIRVDKSVRNLDQVKAGDRLNMTYTEEIIIVIGKTGETPDAAGGRMVGVAPKGAKPGTFMVDTISTSAKVIAVDPVKYRVTLEEPDGKKKTVKVSKKMTNLNQIQAGDSVDISITDALAIEVVR